MAVGLRTRPKSVAGLIPVSMIDWEGRLVSVIFLSGCNLRCPYCHNPELIQGDQTPGLAWDQVADQLNDKSGWIDGVVITGGEPTVSEDLPAILTELRAMGLAVKLDTNGTRPEIIKSLIADGLVDYIAMDVKSAFGRYDVVARVKGRAQQVKTAIDSVIGSGIDHEFRTTMVPGFVDNQDALAIAEYLGARGGARYFLQQFNPQTVLEAPLRAVKPFPQAYLTETARRCAEYLSTTTRGVS